MVVPKSRGPNVASLGLLGAMVIGSLGLSSSRRLTAHI